MIERPASKPGAAGTAIDWDTLHPDRLSLHSAKALIVDQSGRVVYAKQADSPTPIASITKLMTAMVVLDSGVNLDQVITVRAADRDWEKSTGSRLRTDQASLSRREMLMIALMASENRAAAALGRTTFPGGTADFVRAMNRKAAQLGMSATRFIDTTGLNPGNQASPRDLVKMLQAAYEYPLIRQATTTPSMEVRPYPKRAALAYRNTNRLVRQDSWEIGLSKTGYISEAGRCLAMRATIAGRPLYIVLLDSFGKLTPIGDSNRLRKWIEEALAKG
jgi:D-alanyl-D-alanine endopeptidase (penicillin-binding protein 7)